MEKSSRYVRVVFEPTNLFADANQAYCRVAAFMKVNSNYKRHREKVNCKAKLEQMVRFVTLNVHGEQSVSSTTTFCFIQKAKAAARAK